KILHDAGDCCRRMMNSLRNLSLVEALRKQFRHTAFSVRKRANGCADFFCKFIPFEEVIELRFEWDDSATLESAMWDLFSRKLAMALYNKRAEVLLLEFALKQCDPSVRAPLKDYALVLRRIIP